MSDQNKSHRKWLNKVIIISLLFILVMLLSQSLFAKTLTVKTDRQEIEMGDIINLIVQTDFQTFSQPDFSILEDQFDILGRQRSSQITMVNGNFQAYSRWDLSLTPKQSGILKIPPLTISGISSEPYTLKVTQLKAHQPKTAPSFLESSVNLTEAHVQQEIIFTLRFYHQGQLIDGNIRPPNFGSAISMKLRNQVNYQKQIGNRTYEVYEWSWAFFPQQSGEIIIPAQSFDGRMQYRGRIKMIKDRSKPIQIHVLPQVATYPQDQIWLPARRITLSEQWQNLTSIRVGDSVARQIQVRAEGLMASQLPDFQFDNQKGYHVYPGQTDNQNQKTDIGVQSAKTIEVAIVATASGEITFPKIEIPWWNTEKQQMEMAVLPEKTLTILPALNAQILPENQTNTQIVSHETPIGTTSNSSTWQIVAIVFAGLWIITLVLFWQQRKRHKVTQEISNHKFDSSDNPSEKSISELDQICQLKDARSFYQAFMKWHHNRTYATTDTLEKDLDALKQHLYNQQSLPEETLSNICQALQQNNLDQENVKKQAGRQLDELYLH